MEVDGDACLSHSQDFEWFKKYKERRGEIEYDQHPCRRWTSKAEANIEKVGETVKKIIAWAFKQLLN
jgi:hypothetical protein